MNEKSLIIGIGGALATGVSFAISIILGIVIGSVIGIGAISWIGWKIHQKIHDDLIRMEHDRLDIQLHQAQVKAEHRKAEVVSVVGSNGSMAIGDVGGGTWNMIQPVLKAPMMHGPGMIQHGHEKPDPPEQIEDKIPELLPAIQNLDRIAIFGGQGTGKSELLKHLVDAKTKQADVLIVDSHAAPDTWPMGRVVGMGRNYAEIEQFLQAIAGELDKRYRQLATGFNSFEPVCVVIDEMTVLNQFVEASEIFKSLLCECRKVNIQMVIAGQSDRVKSLGIAGNGDLKQAFEAVVYLERNGGYFGNVYSGYSKEPVKMSHPGVYDRPFKSQNSAGNNRKRTNTEPGYHEKPNSNGYDYSNPSIGYQAQPDFDSEARTAIYSTLYHQGSLSPKEIVSATGLKSGYVRKTLKEMVNAGHIRIHSRGIYGL